MKPLVFSLLSSIKSSPPITRSVTPPDRTKGKNEAQQLLALAGSTTIHISPKVLEKYTIKEQLGVGASSVVFAAVGECGPVAIKCVFTNKIPITQWKRDRLLGTIPTEIYIHSRLVHPNIIKLIEFFEDHQFFYLVLEYAPKEAQVVPTTMSAPPFHTRQNSTDLFDYIENNPFFAEIKIKTVFSQIISAISYLHGLGIVHGDIKDENIVIDKDLNVKLIDFGSAAYITKPFDTFRGTPAYMPPECILNKPFAGPEVDIWCCGVLLYILSFSKRPFKTPQEALQGKYQLPQYKRSPELMQVIDALLSVDPKCRPKAQDILSFDFFTN